MTAKNLSDSPAELAGLIEYQDGAIVSHTLVKSAAGTVTLFAFARGEELSEHTAPYDALIYVLEGRLLTTIGEKEHAVTGGQILLLPANVPHAVHASEPSKALLVMIRDKADTAS